MSRVSKEQAQINRAAITTASSRLFRERGLNRVSVADLMAEVGLTHGGFYGHFASKDALAAEACGVAFEQALGTWTRRVAAAPAVPRAALIEAYVSVQSRNSRGTTCPTAALAGDVAREPTDAAVRTVYVDGTEALLAILAATEDSGDAATDRRLAMADFATMVGALLLARATAGHALSNEVLAAARERLLAPGERPGRAGRRATKPASEQAAKPVVKRTAKRKAA